jgi:hypothetical protein
VSEEREPPGEGHDVEEPADREAMPVIRGDVTIPLDPDIAADVLLEGSDPLNDEDDSNRSG